MVLASIARIPPAAIAVMKAITASDAFSSEEGAEGDGRAAAWAVLLRRLLATRAFAVFCAGPGQEHVHSDVDHGAGQEPGHGGPQAPSLNRLTDELERQTEISTPAPKDMIEETSLDGMAQFHDAAAPSTSAAPATVPHINA